MRYQKIGIQIRISVVLIRKLSVSKIDADVKWNILPSLISLGVTKVWLFENLICSVLKIGLIFNSCVRGLSLYEQNPGEDR